MLWIGRVPSTQIVRIYFSCNFFVIKNPTSTRLPTVANILSSLRYKTIGVGLSYAPSARKR